MSKVGAGIRKVSFIDPNDGVVTYGILSEHNLGGRILRSEKSRDAVFADIIRGADTLEYVRDFSDFAPALIAWEAMLNQNPFR